MSYNTIYQCANDPAFNNRIVAACAQEDAPNPVLAANQLRWDIATLSDIEQAYASALAGNNPNPGGDESVITDGMILAAVQAGLPNIPPP